MHFKLKVIRINVVLYRNLTFKVSIFYRIVFAYMCVYDYN